MRVCIRKKGETDLYAGSVLYSPKMFNAETGEYVGTCYGLHPAEQKSESNAIVPAQRRGTRSGANIRIFETRRHSRRRIRKHPTEFLRGVANDALRLCGAANRICKERSDGIAYFAPSDLRAEFTQGASGSPGENL